MKKHFFSIVNPTRLWRAFVARSFQANFDATNVVTDASCEPYCEGPPMMPPQTGPKEVVNTLSTLGGNPEPPEAYSVHFITPRLNLPMTYEEWRSI